MNNISKTIFGKAGRSIRKATVVFLTFATIAQPLSPLIVLAEETAISPESIPAAANAVEVIENALVLATPEIPGNADSSEKSETKPAIKTAPDSDNQTPRIIINSISDTSSFSETLESNSSEQSPKTKVAAGAGTEMSAMNASAAGINSVNGLSVSVSNPATTKNQPDIDQNTGALTYSFPITVPPGRSGMQPNLALTYNSSNNEQGSIFGYGWSINIPYIQRLNKFGLNEMYHNTGSSEFFYSSIDGEITSALDNSNLYFARTENGDFNKYLLMDNYWIMHGKDGTQYKFGDYDASRQYDPGNTDHIYKWMLKEIRDTNNNFITFSYYKDANQIYPESIKYTGNGSTDGIFEVSFMKSWRPDNGIVSYDAGFPVTSNYYITEIDTKVNGNWAMKYFLNYNLNPTNTGALLNSIGTQAQAADGVITVLPLEQFSYQNNAPGWAQTATTTLPSISYKPGPGFSFATGDHQQFIDLNGDGLPEFIDFAFLYHGDGIMTSDSCDSQYGSGQGYSLLNAVAAVNRRNYWDSGDTTWKLPQDQNRFFERACLDSDMNVQFADLNGDNLPDLIKSYIDYKYSSPETLRSEVYLNNGNGWTLSPNWKLPSYTLGSQGYATTQIIFGDVNGDNLPDLIETAACSGYHSGSKCSVNNSLVYLNNNGLGWGRNYQWAFGSAPGFASFQFVDLNGDGALELVSSAYGDAGAQIKAYRPGSDWYQGWAEFNSYSINYGKVNTPYSGSILPRTTFADWNNDNRFDAVAYFINNNPANNVINGYKNGISNLSPASLTLPINNSVCGANNSFCVPQFSDTNGDGLQDLVQINSNVTTQGIDFRGAVFANIAQKQDLLSKVSYPQGGETAIAYKTATQYANNKSPYQLFTVSQITNNDNAGNFDSHTYDYSGASYYFDSPMNRKFAGFKIITQTDAAGNVAKTYFNTGNGTDSANGQYADSYYKIGKVYRTEQYDGAGNLYAATINKWDSSQRNINSNFVYPAQTIEQSYDGQATHRDKAQSFLYDNQSGNLIQKTNHGEVIANQDGSFAGIDSAQYTASYSYGLLRGYSTTSYVTSIQIRDQNSNKISESKFYYDWSSYNYIIAGNLTKEENWISGSTYATSYKYYNNYGLVGQSVDPNGNSTNFNYDSYNLYPAEAINAFGQITRYAYDYPSGQVTQTTDANNLLSNTTYDGFGRVLRYLEYPSIQSAKSTFVYTDVIGNFSVQETAYLNSQTAVTGYSYYDGLGRLIQTKKSARKGNFETKDFAYDNRGNLQKESLPYFTANSAKTSPTTNSLLYTTYSYDALGRKTSVANALGTTTYSYKNWQTTITDANSNSKDYSYDAYGNLAKVVEHDDSKDYATAYSYDGLGNLTNITDASGNVRNFHYNGLGRAVNIEDLHAPTATVFGYRGYLYDNAGNLLKLVDAKNRTTAFEYDSINRQKSESIDGSTTKTFTYDNCANGVGRLCQVVMSGETENFEYSILGNLAKDTKVRDNQTFTTQYTYDYQGNPLTITNPDGSIAKFSYNAAGLTESVSRQEPAVAAVGVVSSFDYSPARQVSALNYGSGIATVNTFDPNQLYRLTRKISGVGATNLQDLAYNYDAVGNIIKITDSSATATKKTVAYGYDKLYRLTSVAAANTANNQNYTQNFTYDPLGNMLSQKLNDQTMSYSYQPSSTLANPDAVTSITTNNPLAEPIISTFTATPATINAGATTTLAWTLSGGAPTTLTITPSVGSVLNTLSKVVTVSATTTYTLTATNAVGTTAKTVTVNAKPTAPVIKTFTAAPATINAGATTTLAWTLDGGTPTSLTINNGVGSVLGATSKTVSPVTTATYTLTAANAAGTVTKTVSVTVIPTPVISSFTAAPAAITKGKSATLSWTLTGGTATSLSINNGVGSVLGKTSVTVKPSLTTTYTLTAVGSAGTATATATVTVVAAPTISSFTASSVNINQGGSVTLSWKLGGGAPDTLAIDNNVGSVVGKTSIVVAPTQTTTYKLTSKNIAGTATKTVKVTVKIPAPTITGFTATSVVINKGQSTTLSWTLGGSTPTTLSIDQGVGSVLGATSKIVAPTKTTTYTLTSKNSAGTATKKITITVRRVFLLNDLTSKIVRAAIGSAAKIFAVIADTFSIPTAYAAGATTTANYQYDANGNLLTDGKTTYTYDYQNRIVSTATGITGASTVSAYSYDFQGQRDKSVVTITTTDAATGNVTIKVITTYTPTSYYSSSVTTTTVKSKTGTVLSATTAPAEITKHIFANGRMLATVRGTGASAKAYVTLTDSLNGSTVVLDSNNAIVETTDYYPFGAIRFDNQVNSYNEKRKYIGQEYDAETSLSYLNARYYNGTIGRFITQDPVFWGNQNLSDPQSLNAYSYANNNPITLSDPSGLMTLAEIQTQIDSIKSQIGTLTKAVGDYTAQAGKAAVNGVKSAATTAYNATTGTVAKAKNYVSNSDPDKNIFASRKNPNGTDGLSNFDAFLTFGMPGVGGMMVGAGKGIGKTAIVVKKALADENKFTHLFNNTKHGLAPLVEQFGSQKNVIQEVAKNIVGKYQGSGVNEIVVKIGDTMVTVRGQIVDGIERIGTFFVKN
ncbi:MAG: FG-GAP-like repeat-containing protein [Candidatus Nealsonbacteria bacterium DGGOD1a]|nr:MAG: FG-GAP-like repeat-containing protein [Candidatus Nealsonbacteria bacterium DGGOD1a]